MKHPVWLLVLPVALMAGSGPGFAQSARTASPNAQALQQLQQLASERTQLQAENARLKADLEAARKERDALKTAQEGVARRGRGAEAELARVQADNARLEGEVARQKQQQDELVARFRETAGTMREIETDRADKTQRLTQSEQDLKSCIDHNAKLYALNKEVLDKFESQGFWSALAAREPFTQLKRTELENLADGYRDTADDNRIPATPKP